MVRIRMSRLGRKNRAFFRLGAYESTVRRNGRCLENLGWYDPFATTETKQWNIDLERVIFWLSKGAQATPKTAVLLKKAGVTFPEHSKTTKAS